VSFADHNGVAARDLRLSLARRVIAMAHAGANREQSLEIVIDALVTDEEFRDAFLRNPRRTLQYSSDWGLPLCESETYSLLAAERQLWDNLVEELDLRLQEAA
jgi:hypothetical protein